MAYDPNYWNQQYQVNPDESIPGSTPFDPNQINASGGFLNINNWFGDDEEDSLEEDPGYMDRPGMFGKPRGFGSGQGWLSRIGQGGGGFMGQFGTGQGKLAQMFNRGNPSTGGPPAGGVAGGGTGEERAKANWEWKDLFAGYDDAQPYL